MSWELLKNYARDVWNDLKAWEKKKPHDIGAWVAVIGVVLFLLGKMLAPLGIVMVFAAVVYMIYRLWDDYQKH